MCACVYVCRLFTERASRTTSAGCRRRLFDSTCQRHIRHCNLFQVAVAVAFAVAVGVPVAIGLTFIALSHTIHVPPSQLHGRQPLFSSFSHSDLPIISRVTFVYKSCKQFHIDLNTHIRMYVCMYVCTLIWVSYTHKMYICMSIKITVIYAKWNCYC